MRFDRPLAALTLCCNDCTTRSSGQETCRLGHDPWKMWDPLREEAGATFGRLPSPRNDVDWTKRQGRSRCAKSKSLRTDWTGKLEFPLVPPEEYSPEASTGEVKSECGLDVRSRRLRVVALAKVRYDLSCLSGFLWCGLSGRRLMSVGSHMSNSGDSEEVALCTTPL
jgi:hypothetical protein